MLDFSHIPQNLRSNFSVFYNNGRTSSVYDGWQVWNKPRGVTSIYILCIGAGGRGAAGGSAGTASPAAGGGGGGSGGITTALIQASMIPDILYVYVGIVEATGAFQTNTYVSLQPSTTAAYTVCYANYGSNASTLNGGAGGAAATTTNMILGSYGIYDTYAGQNGASGVSEAIGGSVTWGTLIVSGGAAGGGKRNNTNGYSGGSITGAGFMPTINGGSGGSSGVDGLTGMSFNQPLMFCGGSGGGGTFNANAAGTGGNGGIGSGGGGGGAFTTGGSSAAGTGGPGLVLIWGF